VRQYPHFGMVLQLAQNLISLGSGQRLALIVDPAGILFDWVMGLQNCANGRNNRRGRRWYEQRNQRTVVEP
jgi:hypothetical protein